MDHIYPISARVSGHVVKVNFDDGQFVHQGDVLVQLDPTDYKVAVERAQADYAIRRLTAEAAEYGVPVSSVGSVSANSFRRCRYGKRPGRPGSGAEAGGQRPRHRWSKPKLTAKKLNDDVERYQQLLGKREISQQQFDAGHLLPPPRPTLPSKPAKRRCWPPGPSAAGRNRASTQANAEIQQRARLLRSKWQPPQAKAQSAGCTGAAL